VTLNGRQPDVIVGLQQIDPIPDVGAVTFLNAESDDTKRLLSHFGLASCPPPLELVERFMIPFWENRKLLRNWTTPGKEKIAESLFRIYYELDGDSKKRISSLAIVPVKRISGERANKFSMAKELIDPSNERLRELFFEEEEACPVDWVLERYTSILIRCGLRRALDDGLVVERVKCYERRTQETVETSKRAKALLRSFLPWKPGSDDGVTKTLRELRWLPVSDIHGLPVFKNAQECQGLDAKLLVGLVRPVLDFEVSRDWPNRLGWNRLIPPATLLAQLKRGIEQENRKVVDAVLNYVYEKSQLEVVRQELLKLSCVVASNGQFVSIQNAFQSGCERLQPYFYNIERGFLVEHKPLLLELGVTEKPNLQNLLGIQDQLASKDKLDESEIPIAIEVITLASTFKKSDLSSLKILDSTGRLRAKQDVTYRDLGSSTITGTFHSTHPDIRKTVINALQIEPLSARVKKGELGISDADDDEFDQHEDVATAISDTLTRYTVESTFKEFLANADDCKDATKLNWLLDKRSHDDKKKYLLTKELRDFQGPALLVHNDGGKHKLELPLFKADMESQCLTRKISKDSNVLGEVVREMMHQLSESSVEDHRLCIIGPMFRCCCQANT
jgi:sacsin